MKDSFNTAFSLVIGAEGGYVNDSQDPGGETMYGISKRSYPKEDIRNLTLDRARQIYLLDYWSKIGGDDLPVGLDIAAFDCAVNMGIAPTTRMLSEAGGDLGKFMRLRLARYSDIVKNRPVSLKYLRGWLVRVLNLWDKIEEVTA